MTSASRKCASPRRQSRVSRAAVATAELDLEFTRITAPVSGRVSQREVGIGNLIAGGDRQRTTLLTTIVSLDPIYFDFDMSESDFLAYQRATARGRLAAVQRDGAIVPVQARLFDERDWPLEGRIDFIDNQVDRGAGTIRVARRLRQPRRLMLTPGQFGRLRLPGSERYTAILVPDSAIVTDQSQQDRHDRGRGRHGGAQAGAPRPDRGRPADHPLRPRADRPRHHQRPRPRPARRQGHAAGRRDRTGATQADAAAR